MEIPPDDGAADLRWKAKAKRSPPPTADEIYAAEALVLLASGFSNPTLVDTFSRPNNDHKIPLSAAGDTPPAAANMKRQGSPDTPLRKSSNHYCLKCGQVFQSSQALGGHMTSHRAKIAGDRGCRRTSAGEFHYQCDDCHEKFATGQALGGHKRKHYDGPPLARKANSNRTAGEESSGGGATAHDRPVFHLDLNLPPPPEE